MGDVYVGGAKILLDPSRAIGKGGEADVYDVGGGIALKLFKTPDHPDYQGNKHEQNTARERILIHQDKLRDFPKGLPSRVVTPKEFATDRTGRKIVGYTMSFLRGAEVLMRYSDRGFRESGVPNDTVVKIFQDLHGTVMGIHKAGVIIGDFNDLNILVANQVEANVIDADSFQFGNFLCKVFTARFVDPLKCDPKATSLMLNRPHTTESDWYAYSVMLMQCLLYVDPYGGVYNPKDIKKRIQHGARPLHRITVFNPEVKYPKPAIPYGVLPDELLDFFHRIFEKDKREEFPFKLLDLRWTKCLSCGTEHTRRTCPKCAFAAPGAVREVTTVRGTVTATQIFQTGGVILFATHQGGKLRWLYHESELFKREDGSVVISGPLDSHMRYRVKGQSTLLAKNGRVATLTPGQETDQLAVDSFGTLPIFDNNEHSRYWISNGQLLRDGPFGSEYIGDVLEGQTLFWVGPKFGFGFYRAGNLNVAFVFDGQSRGINDSVKMPRIAGQLIDSTCVFTNSRCWFFVTLREGGKTLNRCMVVRSDGVVEATAETEAGDCSWLGTIRGKFAAGNFLLSATDEGIVRVDIENGNIAESRKFPDTEPFVDSSSNLFADTHSVYVVCRNEIWQLRIS